MLTVLRGYRVPGTVAPRLTSAVAGRGRGAEARCCGRPTTTANARPAGSTRNRHRQWWPKEVAPSKVGDDSEPAGPPMTLGNMRELGVQRCACPAPRSRR